MKKAFTLMELMVVIGIIGILTSVLLVSLSGSTDAAKAAKCQANMHSLGLGVLSQAMSSHYYPYAGSIVKQKDMSRKEQIVVQGWIGWTENSPSSSYTSPYDQSWATRYACLTNGSIWQAVSANAEVFVCPIHREAFKKSNPTAKYPPCWSYVMNAKFKWASQTKPFPHRFSSCYYDGLANKSKTLMFAELPCIKNDIVGDVEFETGATTRNDPILQYQGCTGGGDELIGFNHHIGKRDIYAHVCYADGHVEKLLLPRNAGESNIKELTKWLCDPEDGVDVVLEGDQYKKLEN